MTDEQNETQGQQVQPEAPQQGGAPVDPVDNSEKQDVDTTPAAPVEQAPTGERRTIGGKEYDYTPEGGHRAV